MAFTLIAATHRTRKKVFYLELGVGESEEVGPLLLSCPQDARIELGTQRIRATRTFQALKMRETLPPWDTQATLFPCCKHDAFGETSCG